MSRNHDCLNPRRWAETRKAAFQRDNFRCRKCGKTGRLEGHHEPPLTASTDPYDPNGVLTYCRTCHIERHRPDNVDPAVREWLDFLNAAL